MPKNSNCCAVLVERATFDELDEPGASRAGNHPCPCRTQWGAVPFHRPSRTDSPVERARRTPSRTLDSRPDHPTNRNSPFPPSPQRRPRSPTIPQRPQRYRELPPPRPSPERWDQRLASRGPAFLRSAVHKTIWITTGIFLQQLHRWRRLRRGKRFANQIMTSKNAVVANSRQAAKRPEVTLSCCDKLIAGGRVWLGFRGSAHDQNSFTRDLIGGSAHPVRHLAETLAELSRVICLARCRGRTL